MFVESSTCRAPGRAFSSRALIVQHLLYTTVDCTTPDCVATSTFLATIVVAIPRRK